MKKTYLFLTITVLTVLAASCGLYLWNETPADQFEALQLLRQTKMALPESDIKQKTADAETAKNDENIKEEKTKQEEMADRDEKAPDSGAKNAPTLTSFLKNAALARDQVLYVWGGGWNEEDTAGNEEANHLGLSQSWLDFYKANSGAYNYEDHTYEIHSGLDCSGYIGWVLFNTLRDEKDHVVLADQFDEVLSRQGLGTRKEAAEVTEILP